MNVSADTDGDAVEKPANGRLAGTLTERFDAVDWNRVEAALMADGYTVLPRILSVEECLDAIAIYDQEQAFRSRIIMARYAFGRGEYKYFKYPLPPIVQTLRKVLYGRLAPIANHWHESMRMSERFPLDHSDFIESCRADGQHRPTPLMLRYGADDYCCLHQDLYGAHVFPLQAVFLLSAPTSDFTGGEFLLTDHDPRRPGRGEVVPLTQGQVVVFAVNSRPVRGTRGFTRSSMRHGVSRLQSGSRHTLGIIFHDAK